MIEETFVLFSTNVKDKPGTGNYPPVPDDPYAVEVRPDYREVPKNNLYKIHSHEYYEIIYTPTGNIKYYIEGSVYFMEPGDFMLLKKGERHTIFVDGDVPCQRTVILFLLENLIGPYAEQLKKFLDDRLPGKDNHYPAKILNSPQCAWLMEQMGEMDTNIGKHAYLTALLWQLYKASPKLQSLNKQPQDLVTNVIRYINTHLSEPLSIAGLCEEFFVSKAHLNRKFRLSAGSSVWDYIINKRLLLARDLLREGNSPSEACAKSGFSDYSSFYRMFNRQFEISPQGYIRRYFATKKSP